jgi:long-chain acyl-CoA synthetase
VIRQIETYRPTVFHAVPAMLVAINEQLRSRPADMSSLKWVISGGAPLEPSVAAELSEHSGAMVVEGYGLSEASPVTHVGPLFGAPSYGTVGMPLPETQCRIVDVETGKVDVPDGEVGELVVRGPQVMLGYWNDVAATRSSIRDGWLHTGDLATRDERGLYRIVGRKKDLIITSGYNVYPSEVEAVLAAAPGVREAAVVGEPDPQRGEIVKAFVVLEPDAPWDEAALEAYCREHLAKHKRPRRFERCAGELPRNFLGKVIRRHLRRPPTLTNEQEVA